MVANISVFLIIGLVDNMRKPRHGNIFFQWQMFANLFLNDNLMTLQKLIEVYPKEWNKDLFLMCNGMLFALESHVFVIYSNT